MQGDGDFESVVQRTLKMLAQRDIHVCAEDLRRYVGGAERLKRLKKEEIVRAVEIGLNRAYRSR